MNITQSDKNQATVVINDAFDDVYNKLIHTLPKTNKNPLTKSVFSRQNMNAYFYSGYIDTLNWIKNDNLIIDVLRKSFAEYFNGIIIPNDDNKQEIYKYYFDGYINALKHIENNKIAIDIMKKSFETVFTSRVIEIKLDTSNLFINVWFNFYLIASRTTITLFENKYKIISKHATKYIKMY